MVKKTKVQRGIDSIFKDLGTDLKELNLKEKWEKSPEKNAPEYFKCPHCGVVFRLIEKPQKWTYDDHGF